MAAAAAVGQEEDRDEDAKSGKVINRTFLPLHQITALSEQDVEGVQKKLEEFLNFKQLKTSLKEAILLDYYTAGFWWAKEMDFSLAQLSGFMDLLNFLLENLRDKHMTLGDNLKELGRAMAGIGETDSEGSGDLSFFSTEQAKAIIDYLNISLFKHYKLYKYLFHLRGEELVISNECNVLPQQNDHSSDACLTVASNKSPNINLVMISKYVIELAQPADPPLPDLSEEDIPSDICLSPIIAPTAAETESQGADQECYLEEPCPEAEADVTAEDQKSAADETPNEIIGNLEVEINEKLPMQEGGYASGTEN